jgi:hypothetical protein
MLDQGIRDQLTTHFATLSTALTAFEDRIHPS